MQWAHNSRTRNIDTLNTNNQCCRWPCWIVPVYTNIWLGNVWCAWCTPFLIVKMQAARKGLPSLPSAVCHAWNEALCAPAEENHWSLRHGSQWTITHRWNVRSDWLHYSAPCESGTNKPTRCASLSLDVALDIALCKNETVLENDQSGIHTVYCRTQCDRSRA